MSRRLAAAGAGILVLVSTIGEGGAAPGSLLLIHALILALLLADLATTSGAEGTAGALPAGPASAYLVFAVLAAAGALVAPYRFAAVLVLVEIAAFLVAAHVAARAGCSIPGALALPLLAGAGIQGVLAVMERLRGELRPAGTFFNANHLAAWVVAALLVGAGAALEGRFRGRALVAPAVAAGAALPAVVLSGSRGALLGLAAGTAYLGAVHGRRLDRKARRAAVAAGAVLLLAAGAGIAGRLRQGDPYPYHRVRIWRASLSAVARAPWLGTGPGQFAAAAPNLNFPNESGPFRYSRSFASTHSDLLRAPSEFGVPAFLALALAAGLGARDLRRRAREGTLGDGATGAAAALAAMAAQASVDNLSERPALYLLAAVLLGGLLSRSAPSSAAPGWKWRLTAAALLLTGFAAADVAPYLAHRSAHGLPRGRLAAGSRERLRAALRWNPFHPDLWLRRAEDIAGNGSDWSVAAYADAREAAERAVRLQPADARYRLGLARIEGLACLTLLRDEGTRARARVAYEAASSLSRSDATIHVEAGEFLLAAGDPKGAAAQAESALGLEPEGVLPRVLLADALAQAGASSVARAEEALSAASERAARWKDWIPVGPYEETLLRFDPARADAIRASLAAEREPGGEADLRSPTPACRGAAPPGRP